jgi:hypothetical protein
MIYKNSLTHIFILILFISVQNFAQVYSQEDEKVCNSKFQFAVNSELSAKPISEVVVEIGKSFMGTNYLAYGLERDGDEQLVINLTGFDCTTFLENVLVFARCIKQNKTSFEDFKAELTLIRYREGKINKYPSRLHYFTDWIYDNEKKKIITDVTEELGGEELLLKLSFMSDNPQYYKQLEQNPDFISVIRKQESEINFCREYFFIPKLKVADVESEFQNGDIVAFTSNIRGLDVNHVGIAVKMENGRTHILHAPEAGTKVQITEQPLSEYIMNVKKHTGVIVLRVNEPQ